MKGRDEGQDIWKCCRISPAISLATPPALGVLGFLFSVTRIYPAAGCDLRSLLIELLRMLLSGL